MCYGEGKERGCPMDDVVGIMEEKQIRPVAYDKADLF